MVPAHPRRSLDISRDDRQLWGLDGERSGDSKNMLIITKPFRIATSFLSYHPCVVSFRAIERNFLTHKNLSSVKWASTPNLK